MEKGPISDRLEDLVTLQEAAGKGATQAVIDHLRLESLPVPKKGSEEKIPNLESLP